jgi:hypothetical protein
MTTPDKDRTMNQDVATGAPKDPAVPVDFIRQRVTAVTRLAVRLVQPAGACGTADCAHVSVAALASRLKKQLSPLCAPRRTNFL